jgi:hypothetical protein
MRSTRLLLAAVAAFAAIASGAAGQTADGGPRHAPGAGRFSVMPHVGTELDLGGNFTESARATFAPLATLGKINFDTAGNISVDARKFGDLYAMPVDIGIDLAYGLSDHGEVFGGFRYLRATGKRGAIGTVNATGSVTATGFGPGAILSAQLENFGATSVEVGYRHFLAVGGPLLPYVAGSLGANRTGAIGGEIFVRNNAGIDDSAGKLRLFQQSYALTGGLQIGATYAIAPQAAMGVELGARYVGPMRGNDSDLVGGDNGLLAVNDSAGRWTLPIRLTGRIAF